MRNRVLLAVLFMGTSAAADIIHVPDDYPTIQAAILAALEGDEIIVAPGSYNEAIFFNGHNITLRSSGGPDVTTIDATGLGNSVVRVILGEGPTTTLDGFTITGGNATNGGGLYVNLSSLSVTNCRVINNTASNFGGAASLFQAAAGLSFVGCKFRDNSADEGGAVHNFNSEPITFQLCEFIGNSAFSGGAAVTRANTTTTFLSCRFVNNSATAWGGAIYCASSTIAINCLFAENHTDTKGGAIYAGGTLTLTNCTIAGNTASQNEGGGIHLATFGATVINCIAWGNIPDSLSGTPTALAEYNDIEFGWPGCDFCILADPLFAAPLDDNYRLTPGSPCIDLGKNAAVPIGVVTDLDGNPRFIDDPDTPDCPQPGADCGIPPIVDMGAYEFDFCPWDLDSNCEVGAGDLLLLLANWGNPYGASDLLALLAAWGPCQCNPFADPLSLQEELDDACLTWDDWNEYVEVMTSSESSQADKDRYDCWMTHYMFHCNKCFCVDLPNCPNPDPFG